VGQEPTKSLPKILRSDALSVLMHRLIFSFHADFGFIAIYGFIAVSYNLMVTFGDAHWAKLIRPQHSAGITACPPRR